MMTYLKKLSLSDGVEIYDMLQEISANDNGFHNRVYGMTCNEFNEWLKNEYAIDNGELQDWMVPQTSYWLFDDKYPVGYGRIRHYLNERLIETSGHIGYAIRNTERSKGYGNIIFSLLLDECRRLGIKTVQIGTKSDNIASNKIILRHGGILTRSSEGKNFYHIHITKES